MHCSHYTLPFIYLLCTHKDIDILSPSLRKFVRYIQLNNENSFVILLQCACHKKNFTKSSE